MVVLKMPDIFRKILSPEDLSPNPIITIVDPNPIITISQMTRCYIFQTTEQAKWPGIAYLRQLSRLYDHCLSSETWDNWPGQMTLYRSSETTDKAKWPLSLRETTDQAKWPGAAHLRQLSRLHDHCRSSEIWGNWAGQMTRCRSSETTTWA